ncbi:hypothetical protein HZB02_04570 [Candidatus Woesearchaeota archaeon]|nr:hypothetical protein [Candidatus Woesearchaeota archaeon]
MVTTIQVKESTKQLLEELKRERVVASYDQVILDLALKAKEVPKSMFGAAKGRKLTVERVRMRELNLRP